MQLLLVCSIKSQVSFSPFPPFSFCLLYDHNDAVVEKYLKPFALLVEFLSLIPSNSSLTVVQMANVAITNELRNEFPKKKLQKKNERDEQVRAEKYYIIAAKVKMS